MTQLLLPRTAAAAAWVSGVGSLLAAPVSLGLLYGAGDLHTAMWFFLGKVLLGECWAGPALSIAQGMVPKKGGTSGLASFLAFLTFVGTLGPLVVGALHDRGWGLDTLLCLSVTCPFAVAGLLFVGLALNNPDGFLPLHVPLGVSDADDADRVSSSEDQALP